jgi:hypothetical protein
MEKNQFISEYNYSIILPENWSEYESDEKNTNAFFDTTNWTGNLRITPLNYYIKNPKEYLEKNKIEKKAELFDWKNIQGIYFVDNSSNNEINYWFIIENNRLFICSFFIGQLNGKEEIEKELNKVEIILKTLKSN